VSELSRRSFAESLATAALAPLIGVQPDSIRLTGRVGSGTRQVADDPGALANALAEVIRSQYGSRLSAADLVTITRQIQSGLEQVDELRKVALANGDEPDFVFAAIRRTPPPHD
jgi:hypothetical protein